MGISIALYESYIYDDQAKLLSINLSKYGLPTALDLPEI